MYDLERGNRQPWLTTTLGIAVLLSLTWPASADFRESFRAGVKAYDEERWSESVTHLRQALQERPHADAGKITIFSSLRIAYVPNTFLGIALHRLGLCEDAMPFFDQAEAQSIAPAHARRYYKEMLEARRGCTQTLLTQTIAAARSALRTAEEKKAALDDLLTRPVGLRLLDENPTLRQRADGGRDALRDAEARLEAGAQSSSYTTVREAAGLAERATIELQTVTRDLNIQIASSVGFAHQEVEEAVRTARQNEAALAELRQSPALAAALESPSLQMLLQEAESLLGSVDREIATAFSGQDLEKLRELHDNAVQADRRYGQVIETARAEAAADARREVASTPTRSPRPTAATPTRDPASAPTTAETSDPLPSEMELTTLEGALDRYFTGEFNAVLLELDPTSWRDPELRAVAHLFRAAAAFSLLRLGGTDDPRLAERVTGEINAALTSDPLVMAPIRFFPPPFLSMVESARDAPR